MGASSGALPTAQTAAAKAHELEIMSSKNAGGGSGAGVMIGVIGGLVGGLIGLVALLMAVPAVSKPLLRPLVCPSGSKDMVVVSYSGTAPRGGTRITFDYYCIDRNGAPRYVSNGKLFGTLAIGLVGLAGLLGLALFLIVSARRKRAGLGKSVAVIFAVSSLLWTSCTSGTMSSSDFQEKFRGYLWTSAGQQAFKEDVLEELGKRSHKLRNLQFRGTRADFVLGPGTSGRYYYYDMGKLVKAGRASFPHPSPCLMDLSDLDPEALPKAVAKAKQEAPAGFQVQNVRVSGPESDAGGTCRSFVFHIKGRTPSGHTWRRSYGQ